MLPTTKFSNLRRFTRIAQCATGVARPCKSITFNSDCYFLSLKCYKSEKRKIDSIAAVRKPLAVPLLDRPPCSVKRWRRIAG
jgi:hypothetical protein